MAQGHRKDIDGKMKSKIKSLAGCTHYLLIILALFGCVGQPIEPVATTHVSQQEAPTETVECQSTEPIQAGAVGVEKPVDENERFNSNFFGWVEMHDPQFDFRFSIPCFWHVDFPEQYGIGQAYSIRNYSYEYAMSFPPDIHDMWERGGIKIDIVIAKRLHPSISMSEYIARSHREDPSSRIVSIEELQINDQDVLYVTTDSITFGTGHYYMFTLSDKAFLIFSPSPGSHENPDVQAILHSIIFDPDVDLILPDFYPGVPPEGVIADCRSANRLKALLVGPKSIAWGSGEAIKVQFALVNTTDQTLHILDWLTPFEGIAGNIFRVERDGQLVSYHGMLMSRGDPTPDSYLLIKPKGAITIEVNLSEVYDFSRPGRYTIAYKSPTSSSIAESEADFALTLESLGLVVIPSNKITVEIVLKD